MVKRNCGSCQYAHRSMANEPCVTCVFDEDRPSYKSVLYNPKSNKMDKIKEKMLGGNNENRNSNI